MRNVENGPSWCPSVWSTDPECWVGEFPQQREGRQGWCLGTGAAPGRGSAVSAPVLPNRPWRQGRAHLLGVLAHVGEDLRERAHGVELVHVHPGLLGQVGIHVLVTDGRHLPDV